MNGRRVLARFVLIDRIGSGGFGAVYRALDERLQREVAVKVIPGTGRTAERALREAQAAARLNHPGIVSIYELGRDGPDTILVSELVRGMTLAEHREAGTLSDRDVGALGAELAAALAHAHRRGVVHRDVKPQNVIVEESTFEAKLTDFGIARVSGGKPLTASGDVIGTLAYMAPEQAEGEQASAASDVYSLALTLYELWAGQNPVLGRSAAETVRRIGSPPALGEFRKGLPAGVLDMVDACLSLDPEDRPPAEVVAESLEAVLPELDDSQPLRPVPPLERIVRAATLTGHGGMRAVAGSLAVAVLAASAFAWVAGEASGPLLAAAAASGALWCLAPRLAYLAIAAILGAAGFDAGFDGRATLALAAAALPPLLALGGRRSWLVPAAAPPLALASLGPLFPALAGLAGTAPRRAGLAAAGIVWVAIAEAASGRRLVFGSGDDPPGDWATDPGAALDALSGAVTEATLLGIVLWATAAVVLPWVVRGRTPVLDLLGALLWGAALVAAHGLIAEAAGMSASPVPAIAVGIAILALVPAALYRRAREAIPEPRAAGAEPASV